MEGEAMIDPFDLALSHSPTLPTASLLGPSLLPYKRLGAQVLYFITDTRFNVYVIT
jgi:hypothetical protein